MIRFLEQYPVVVQTIPDITDVVSGKAKIEEIRDVDIEDLLGRDEVSPDRELLADCITKKSVLVTGAGGSIGSELCRQIVRLSPSKLILVDSSEFALYEIERELNKPVVSANQALFWESVRTAGYDAPINGYGKLLKMELS